MSAGTLTIDLDAVTANWRALDAMTQCETGAVVKADAYGLGGARVARALAHAGCRRFHVATAAEGADIRRALGPGPEISVFAGHMAGDTETIGDLALTPLLNSIDQVTRHFEALPGAPFGVQLDTGMNRLGLEWEDWAQIAEIVLDQRPTVLMSHLACADTPDHPMNAYQRDVFDRMTDGLGVARSLAATGGMLLGREYHYELCRPGIGLYGGFPFTRARPAVTLDLPVIQCRDLGPGEVAGYANAWQAERPTRLAICAGGYADGLHRVLSDRATLWHGAVPCPLVGRVSMDMVIVDITDLADDPETLTVLGPQQGVDALAEQAGTIGYEVLTSLGGRYTRRYASGG